MSKPDENSEALKGSFEKALRCFLVLLKTEGSPTNVAFKNVVRRELSRQKIKLLWSGETYNKEDFPAKR